MGMMKAMRLGQDRIRNNCCLPRQPIRTCRSRTAPCRWSGGCPRPHSGGRRGWTPCRSWGRTGSAHRLPRWTATKAERTAWSASSRRAEAGVGKAQCRRVQAREASCSDGMCSGAIGGAGALPRPRHGRPKRLRRVQEHAGADARRSGQSRGEGVPPSTEAELTWGAAMQHDLSI
jgi:hypothetical protein